MIATKARSKIVFTGKEVLCQRVHDIYPTTQAGHAPKKSHPKFNRNEADPLYFNRLGLRGRDNSLALRIKPKAKMLSNLSATALLDSRTRALLL